MIGNFQSLGELEAMENLKLLFSLSRLNYDFPQKYGCNSELTNFKPYLVAMQPCCLLFYDHQIGDCETH